jgi:dTDP-4-dehydrorhamnose reductase
MNILLTGGSGQLGKELLGQLTRFGKVTAVDRLPGAAGSLEADLSDLGRVETLLHRLQPDAVINAAAYTAVDQAENEVRAAFRMNAELPDCLGRWCRLHDRFLLHFSTDYVFDGESRRPFREDDRPGPLGVYGETKLAGEWALGASGCRHLVLRTSWVYSAHGSNFVLSMLRLGRERSELGVVNDQTGCPTWARNLATTSAVILQHVTGHAWSKEVQGVFHYCDNTPVTWYDFAGLIFDQAEKLELLQNIPSVNPIPSTEFPQLAQRPRYSVLDTALIQNTFAVRPPQLLTSLQACLQELV